MSQQTLWILIISIGLATFAIRISFILLSDYLHLPAIIEQGLRYVPVATLTAIALPALVFNQGQLQLTASNYRLLAGFVAILAAYFTRNTMITIIAGMGVLWLLQWFSVVF